MKSHIIIIPILAIIVASFYINNTINKISKERYDDTHYITWRGHEWDSKPNANFQFVRYDTAGISDVYLLKNEPLCLGSEHIDSVRYLYHNKKLWQVVVYVKTRESSDVWKKHSSFIGVIDGHSYLAPPSKEVLDSIAKDSSFVNNEKIVSYYNTKYESQLIGTEFSSWRFDPDKMPKKYTVIDANNNYGWHINSADKYDLSLSEYRVQFIPIEGKIIYTAHSGEVEINNEFEFIRQRAKIVADSMAKIQSEINKEKLRKEMGACGI